MLHRHHGASMLGRQLRHSSANAMTSFQGTTYIADDAMRAFAAVFSKPHSAATPAAIPRVWTPKHGVVFGSTPVDSDAHKHTQEGSTNSPANSSMLASDRSPNSHTGSIWQPTRGIVFGNSTPPSPSPLPRYHNFQRNYSTAGAVAYEAELALHSDAEDSYVLASSNASPSGMDSGGNDGNDGNDGDSWSPSAESASLSFESDDPELRILEYEEHSPLTFKISIAELEKAKKAVDTPEGYWSHKLYADETEQKVKVHYCKSKLTTERVLQTYFQDKAVLGFDIEWKPEAKKFSGIKSNVALVQLACEDRIALFHIALYSKDSVEDLVAPSLKQIMENPNITKTGVAIKGDCTRLKTHLNIECRGILELSHLYKLVKHSSDGTTSLINKRLVSLASQVEEHLGLPLYKGDDVRGSDWSKALDIDQIAYAAADSYAGFMLYDVMEAKRKQLTPTPPRPYHAELNLPIRLASGIEISTVDEATAEEATILESGIATTIDSPITSTVKSKATVFAKRKAPSSAKDITVEPEADNRPQSLIAAEAWAREYRSSHPTEVYTKANPRSPASNSQLRAYALWQREGASIPEAVEILGVKDSTFTGYVMDAVRLEKLPFDVVRFKALLNDLPSAVKASWRAKAVMQLLYAGKNAGLPWEQSATASNESGGPKA